MLGRHPARSARRRWIYGASSTGEGARLTAGWSCSVRVRRPKGARGSSCARCHQGGPRQPAPRAKASALARAWSATPRGLGGAARAHRPEGAICSPSPPSSVRPVLWASELEQAVSRREDRQLMVMDLGGSSRNVEPAARARSRRPALRSRRSPGPLLPGFRRPFGSADGRGANAGGGGDSPRPDPPWSRGGGPSSPRCTGSAPRWPSRKPRGRWANSPSCQVREA